MERYQITLCQVGFDSCVAIAGQYTSTSLGTLSRDLLYPALCNVILQHPALCVQIDLGDKSARDIPKFIRLPSIDLDAVVDFVEESPVSIDDLLKSQLKRIFELEVSTPLWHLTVVNGRTVVFAYHHAIADGQSGPAFHASLLAALNNAQDVYSDDDGSMILVPSTLDFIPPIEALTSVSMSFSTIFHELYKMVVPSSWLAGATAWTGNPIPPSPSLDMSVRCWEISAPQTAAILRLCHEHNTTLTAFIYTLVVGTLSKLVSASQTADAQPFKTMSVVIPVSLRRFTGASPLVLCDHVSSVQSYVPLYTIEHGKMDFPWSIAAQFGNRIRAAIDESRQVVGLVGLLYRLGMAESYLRGMLGKKRGTGLTISNLGKFPTKSEQVDEDSWRLGSVFFAQCDVMRGAAVKMNVLGSPTGTTNITFTWGATSVDENLIHTLIIDIQSMLSSTLELSDVS